MARRPGSPAALALGTLLACLAGAALPVGAALAQAQADAPRDYAIPPGPLKQVLNRFAGAAGVNLSYDAALVGDARSDGLRGRHAVAEGFARLLAPHGLEAVPMPAGGYGLRAAPGRPAEAAPILPAVTVTAALPGMPPDAAPAAPLRDAGLGLLGDTVILDSPLSTVSYGATAIQDLQARTVGDVLASDASVRYVSQPGGILDAFTVRGFPVSNGNFGEIAFDGIYGVASNYRVATAYIERVELIKGPSALLGGMAPSGSVGGSINVVPKRPLAEDMTRFTASHAGDAQAGGALDSSRRLGPARSFGMRLNASYDTGRTGLDSQSRRASSVALSLDYRGERLRASVDAVDQREHLDAPSRLLHIVPGIAVPPAPDGQRNLSQPWEYSDVRDQSLLVRAEYDLAPALAWYAAAGGGRTRVDRLFAITPTIVDAAGDVAVTDSRYRFDVSRASAVSGLRWRFPTGPVSHRLAIEASGYRDRLGRSFQSAATTSLSNLYRPASLPALDIAAPASVPTVSETALDSVGIGDTLSVLAERVQLTAGVRRQQVRTDNFDSAGVRAGRYDRAAWTSLLGLVLKPLPALAVYANRSEGLSKGDTAPSSASNAGEVFAPYKSRQLEIGVKVSRDDLQATLSAFQIDKPGGELSGTVFAVSGRQRNRGLELGLYGQAAPGLRLLGSVMLLDAVVSASGNAALAGKTAIGAPALQANLGAGWDVRALPGLTLLAGLAYTGRQYVDAQNTQSLPAWIRADLGARYLAMLGGHELTLRLSLRNLFDRRYWAAVDSYGGLAAAQPRTLTMSASVNF